MSYLQSFLGVENVSPTPKVANWFPRASIIPGRKCFMMYLR